MLVKSNHHDQGYPCTHVWMHQHDCFIQALIYVTYVHVKRGYICTDTGIDASMCSYMQHGGMGQGLCKVYPQSAHGTVMTDQYRGRGFF